MQTFRVGFRNSFMWEIFVEPENSKKYVMWNEGDELEDLEVADYSFKVLLNCKDIDKDPAKMTPVDYLYDGIYFLIESYDIKNSFEGNYVLSILKLIVLLLEDARVMSISCDCFTKDGEIFKGMDSGYIDMIYDSDETEKLPRNQIGLKIFIEENRPILKSIFASAL